MCLEKNQYLDVEFVDLTHEGLGVAKVGGFPIFVKGALIGETGKIKITKLKVKYGYGRLVELYRTSQDRVTPPCSVYPTCGGCQLQHLSYDGQLKIKQKFVKDALERLGKIDNFIVEPTIASPSQWNYRNKSQVPVGVEDGQLVTGFYMKRTHEIISCDYCHIQGDVNNKAISEVRLICQKYSIPVYNEHKHKGILRHILIRSGQVNNELMVVLVTKERNFTYKKELVHDIFNQVDGIVSVVQNVNDKKTNVILGDKSYVLSGKDTLIETIFENEFAVSAQSFLQVNHEAMLTLYSKIIEYGNFTENDIVFDVFCGIGTIALSIAKYVKHVYGVEIVPAAVRDAGQNARQNKITNATFTAGDAGEVLYEWQARGVRPNVIIVDPPRKGCDQKTLEQIVRSGAGRIIYVSCHPGTLARDLRILVKEGYYIKEVQPVDMFPQTTHVECVSQIILKNSRKD